MLSILSRVAHTVSLGYLCTTYATEQADGRKCRWTLAAQAAKGSLSSNDNKVKSNVE